MAFAQANLSSGVADSTTEACAPIGNDMTREELERLSLFQGVDADLVEPVLRSCQVRRIGAGEQLIDRTKANEHLYLILSGSLSVVLDANDATPFTVLSAGDTVGEMSFLDKRAPSADVVATERSRCLAIDEELLWMLVEMSHAVCTNLLFTLVGRIRTGNELYRENQLQLKKFQFHATVDATTGLFNRYWLERMLPRQMNRARKGARLTLLMVDIDHFKQFNDTYGHVMGDHALRAVANSFRSQLRATDMATRFGGEEFLVILPETNIEIATLVGERLRSFVESMPIDCGGDDVVGRVTISVGAAQMPYEGDMESFVKLCDEALYRAKNRGRNCVST